jgi:outer membrane protein OmpA-like peptidoglycan-associated protein
MDDTWTNWATPENMGTAVNSEGRELYFRTYAERGFSIFTTTKSSDGYGDVKLFAQGEPALPVKDSVIYASIKPESVVKEPKPAEEARLNEELTNNETKVHGKILNAKTGEPIAAKISFAGPALPGKSTSSNEEGYAVSVPSSQYVIRIEANGYISTMENLDINATDMRELEMNFRLQPVEIGTTVNLKNVLFMQAKTDILPESFPELDLVVSFLNENPKVKIELMGHTDGRGVHSDNVKLSLQRVNKVKDYLVSKGIDSRRISGKGFGGSKPIASNDTEASRKMNRRVEFVIKKF